MRSAIHRGCIGLFTRFITKIERKYTLPEETRRAANLRPNDNPCP